VDYCKDLILGPILFIIFINDLVGNRNNGSDEFLYADNAKLFRYIIMMEIYYKRITQYTSVDGKLVIKLE